MDQKKTSRKSPIQDKSIFTGGLGLKLVFWFLLLSLVPMSVISYLNYQNCYEAIMEHLSDSFNEEIDSHTKIIQTHFDMFNRDLMAQANNTQNKLLLENLKRKTYR